MGGCGGTCVWGEGVERSMCVCRGGCGEEHVCVCRGGCGEEHVCVGGGGGGGEGWSGTCAVEVQNHLFMRKQLLHSTSS